LELESERGRPSLRVYRIGAAFDEIGYTAFKISIGVIRLEPDGYSELGKGTVVAAFFNVGYTAFVMDLGLGFALVKVLVGHRNLLRSKRYRRASGEGLHVFP